MESRRGVPQNAARHIPLAWERVNRSCFGSNAALRIPFDLFGSILARSVIGLGLGVLGAILGYFAGWMALGPGTSLAAATAYLTTGTGFGAGVGSAVGWLDFDRSKLANLPALVLALVGGLLGAWGGLGYAAAVYDVDVKTQGARITAVAGAAFAANLVPAVYRLALGVLRRPS